MKTRPLAIAAILSTSVAASAEFIFTAQTRIVEASTIGGTCGCHEYIAAPDFGIFDAVAVGQQLDGHPCCSRAEAEQHSELDSRLITAGLRCYSVGSGSVAHTILDVDFTVDDLTPCEFTGQFGGTGFLLPPSTSTIVRLSGPAGVIVEIEQYGPPDSTQPIRFYGALQPGDYTLFARIDVEVISTIESRAFTDLLLRVPCLGDFNQNETIDLMDLTVFLSHFGDSDAGFAEGDFDYDGAVGIADLTLFLSGFGTTCP